jgi:hypothetical protein
MKKLQFRKFGLTGKLLIILCILIISGSRIIAQSVTDSNSQSKIDTIPQGKDISSDLTLNKEELANFNERAKQKVEQFLNYMKTISLATESNEMRDLALKNAIKLFIKEATVESSYMVGNEWKKKTSLLKNYLHRLRALQTTKVALDFYDLVYLTDFIKVDEENYKATATFYQIYTAYSGDNIKYSDKTTKTIDIILTLVKDEFYGERRWTIFLGNIKVTESSLN